MRRKIWNRHGGVYQPENSSLELCDYLVTDEKDLEYIKLVKGLGLKILTETELMIMLGER